jgi:hypothetical protein
MADDANTAQHKATGLTRRQLLQRGAVAGGIVWTAPLIESVVSSAGAVSNPHHVTIPDCHHTCSGGGVNCSATFIVFQKAGDPKFYVVKIDQCAGTACSTDCGVPGGGTFQDLTCGGHSFFTAAAPNNKIFVDTMANPATCDVANCSSDINISGNTITAGPGITFVFVAVHDGSFGAPEPQWTSFCA